MFDMLGIMPRGTTCEKYPPLQRLSINMSRRLPQEKNRKMSDLHLISC